MHVDTSIYIYTYTDSYTELCNYLHIHAYVGICIHRPICIHAHRYLYMYTLKGIIFLIGTDISTTNVGFEIPINFYFNRKKTPSFVDV